MHVLGVDTTTDALSVAVCEDDHLRTEFTLVAPRKHAERIVDAIDHVLDQAGLRLPGIDLLAVAHGPGSFTGLRIGVSTMKGLALGAHKPLMGVPTLDAMVRGAGIVEGVACPLLDARMDEVYGAVYRIDQDVTEKIHQEYVGPVEALIEGLKAPFIVFGDGARAYRGRILSAAPRVKFLPDSLNISRASSVALEARARLQGGDDADPALVRPVYLRKSQPEQVRARQAREISPA